MNSNSRTSEEFDCLPPKPTPTPTPPSDFDISSIAAVAVANGVTSGQEDASNKGDQAGGKLLMVTDISKMDSHEAKVGINYRVNSVSPEKNDRPISPVATKILMKRETVQRSRIKSAARQRHKQPAPTLRASDLYSHVEKMPVLIKQT